MGRVDGVVIRYVGHGAEGAASGSASCAGPPAARVRGIGPALILRAQASRQRRTQIDALACNCSAIYAFRKAGGYAGGVSVEGSDYAISGEGKILCGDASGWR